MSVVSTKISAIFIGPAGVGIYGLYTSTLTTLENLTSCGLGVSSVKDLAAAREEPEKLAKIYGVLQRLVWMCGVIGFLICLLFAGDLSQMTFGNRDYTTGFRILSLTLLFAQLITGPGSILVGLSQYKAITSLRLTASVLTTLTFCLCYWLMGIQGIVPVIFISSVINLGCNLFFSRKIKLPKVKIAFADIRELGSGMFKSGIMLSLSYLLMSVAGYLIRVYIGRTGDEVTLGLFIASFSLVNTYLGLIFSSIETDFYPRLSASKGIKADYEEIAKSELGLVMLLVAPLVAGMIVFSQPILYVFYSSKFYAAKEIIMWTAVSMAVKVPGWIASVGMMSLGKTQMYLYNQLAYVFLQLGLNILGYYLWGLLGVGITYTIGSLIFSIQSQLMLRRLGYSVISRQAAKLVGIMCAILVCLASIGCWASAPVLYSLGTGIVVVLTICCFRQLNKQTEIITVLRKKFKI